MKFSNFLSMVSYVNIYTLLYNATDVKGTSSLRFIFGKNVYLRLNENRKQNTKRCL